MADSGKLAAGYVRTAVDTELPITITANGVVIKVTYGLRKDLSYKVEYYYDNAAEPFDTDEIKGVTYNTEITEVADSSKLEANYGRFKVETLPAAIVDSTTVIKVYYTLKETSFTVEHYYRESADAQYPETPDVVENGVGKVNDTVTAKEFAKQRYNGMIYDVSETNPENGEIALVLDANTNVLKIYYTLAENQENYADIVVNHSYYLNNEHEGDGEADYPVLKLNKDGQMTASISKFFKTLFGSNTYEVTEPIVITYTVNDDTVVDEIADEGASAGTYEVASATDVVAVSEETTAEAGENVIELQAGDTFTFKRGCSYQIFINYNRTVKEKDPEPEYVTPIYPDDEDKKTEIPEEEVPLAPVPDDKDETIILDEDVPLGNLPQSGATPNRTPWFMGAAAMLTLAGVLFGKKKKHED